MVASASRIVRARRWPPNRPGMDRGGMVSRTRRLWRRAAVVTAAAVCTLAAASALTVAATATAQAPTLDTSKPLSGTVDYSPRYPTVGSVRVAGTVHVVALPNPTGLPKLTRVNTQLINVLFTTDTGLRCAAREPQTFLLPAGTTTFTGSYRLLPAGGPDAPPNPTQPGDQCRDLTLGISYVLQVDQAGTAKEITATPVYSDVNLVD
jgi:hypothetical protein